MDEQKNETQNVEATETKKKNKTLFISIGVIVVALMVAALVWLGSGERGTNSGTESDSSGSTESALVIGESKTYNETNSDGTLTGVEIAEKVSPSVVAVVITQNGSTYGEGSGVVMSTDTDKNVTYVVTCAHLLSSSGTEVSVQTEDGTSYAATVVGYDTRTDVGLISIEGTDALTPAEFGDSAALQVGEPVYAIGNPGGTQFYGSFTAGVVSAIDRLTSSSDSGYTSVVIQHDAAINPGNSGGALVNSYGQVVGINSSKIADTDYEGMGFAIPTSVVQDVVDDLISSGYVQDRAKLGISYVSAGSYSTYSMIVQMNDLPSGSIVVAEIDEDGALYGTDAQEGDLIIAANGKDLETSSVLLDQLDDASPGDTMELTMARVNSDYSVNTYTITVTLAEDKGNTTTETTEEQNSSGGFQNPFSSN